MCLQFSTYPKGGSRLQGYSLGVINIIYRRIIFKSSWDIPVENI
jgi:hypothetical protein